MLTLPPPGLASQWFSVILKGAKIIFAGFLPVFRRSENFKTGEDEVEAP
jgi:hypothetical protein